VRAVKRPRRIWTLTAALVVVAGAAAAALWLHRRPLAAFPLPSAAPADSVSFDDFAGAEACAACHASEHAAWQRSTHGVAGGAVSERRPVHAFDGRPIRFADGDVIPAQSADGELHFTVHASGRGSVTYRVAAIVGAAALYGGGTQAYFTRHEDGSVRMLPWERTASGAWFCNTGTRADRGWVPITADMRLADCGDWPPRRVLGQHETLATCQECHGSQINGGAGSTRWQSLTINCESCHGPARQHVENARSGQALPSLLTLDKQASVALCLRCHALKDALRPGYLPGAAFDAHYSTGLAALSEEGLLPDGRTRSFAYQEGHLYSACYLNGGMTCTDCHAPHALNYRSTRGQPLTGRFDDEQCTSCHASKAVSPAAHTHHLADSPGSRCVGCHMPHLQQPDVGNAIAYARSDHTISIPRPELDSVFGIRGACAACHRDRSNAALATQIAAWYGTVKPLPDPIATLAQDSVDILLAVTQHERQPMAALAMLGRALRRVTLDGTPLDRRTRAALARAANSADSDFAAAALALLHEAHGDERATRNRLVQTLQQHPQREAVRARWIALLGWAGDLLTERGRDGDAAQAYRKALELNANNPSLLRALGYARLRSGDTPGAMSAFREAIRQRPGDALAHVGLGVAHAATGDDVAAAASYSAARSANEHEPLAHFNLGNVALRGGRALEAAGHYERAVQLDPGLSQAHFNLARARLALGQPALAAVAIRSGLALEPGNEPAAQMLTQLEAAGHGIERK
jgi:tetratricopeptide (TPR) repeat protein